MFKKLKEFLKGLFINKEAAVTKLPSASQARLMELKVGDQYTLGEAIVTLHATKESMLAAIAKVDQARELREYVLREKGIDIMLMSPEELLQFQLEAFHNKVNANQSELEKIIGKASPSSILEMLWGKEKAKRWIKPSTPIIDKTLDSFKSVTEQLKDTSVTPTTVNDEEKVKIS